MKKKKQNSAVVSASDVSVSKEDLHIDDVHDMPEPESEAEESFQLTAMPIPGMKAKKKSGGFQSMGLSYPVLKGILKKGYKVPTPIQRKVIPVIMEGKDVVAMARTGSGKTGAFLIPMLEKLKARTSKVGARALIFSPTRELAMQTSKFTKELGRHTGLKTLMVLGGEKMENQFSAIHENPDIIIATPGRFLHLVVEMDLKLLSVEYVVFDEADRLLEMGFQEQIQEVLHRLPDHRQTLMFSATLPSVLVDFVKVGLTDPILLRLDVELKLSENLKTVYLCCRLNDKPAVLLNLLKKINLPQELTVVFLATRHHIEYLKEILAKASIPCSYIYSSLDQTARKINVDKFRTKKVGVLLVTDIAARGIDIPLLDNVINYNFPAKPKLFVHRVGRVARAGRSGTAYSLVSPDETPYLLDLHLFLGKPITFGEENSSNLNTDGLCGSVPQSVIDEEGDALQIYHETSTDIKNMEKVSNNAYKHYVKSRPAPSRESVKRVKVTKFSDNFHPLFTPKNSVELEKNKFLSGMKKYRPSNTIFEIGSTAKNQASSIMRQKRIHHSVVDKIRSFENQTEKEETSPVVTVNLAPSTEASEADIQSTFTSIIISKSRGSANKTEKKKRTDFKDHENYLTHRSKEHYTEKGLGLQGTFEQDASNAVIDLTADDGQQKTKNMWHWDRKKKRFMRDEEGVKNKKMKTESGVWIPKSYKSDLYKKWQENTKFSHREEQSDSETENNNAKQFKKSWKDSKGGRRKPQENTRPGRPPRREMKNKEEILKERKRIARITSHKKHRQGQKGNKKGGHAGGFKKGNSFKKHRK